MLIDCQCMLNVQIINTCVYMQTILDVCNCEYFSTFLMRFQHSQLTVIIISVLNNYPYILHLPFCMFRNYIRGCISQIMFVRESYEYLNDECICLYAMSVCKVYLRCIIFLYIHYVHIYIIGVSSFFYRSFSLFRKMYCVSSCV